MIYLVIKRNYRRGDDVELVTTSQYAAMMHATMLADADFTRTGDDIMGYAKQSELGSDMYVVEVHHVQ